MDKVDFRNVIVNKPWGYEYLMYQSALVGIWCLYIKHGAQTSLHCHPTKKSGLILLEGQARVSFLNDHVDLRPAAKMMIRPGLFHLRDCGLLGFGPTSGHVYVCTLVSRLVGDAQTHRGHPRVRPRYGFESSIRRWPETPRIEAIV